MTLLKPYSDTNYSVIFHGMHPYGTNGCGVQVMNNLTTTGFTWKAYNVSTADSILCWRASGYAE